MVRDGDYVHGKRGQPGDLGEGAGMSEQEFPVGDPRGLRIGAMWLRSAGRPGAIWIEQDDGEGGEFDEAALAEVLALFYAEHF